MSAGNTRLDIRNGDNLEFRGLVMGAMPVKGRLSPTEARGVFSPVRGFRLWWFLLTFLFRAWR